MLQEIIYVTVQFENLTFKKVGYQNVFIPPLHITLSEKINDVHFTLLAFTGILVFVDTTFNLIRIYCIIL